MLEPARREIAQESVFQLGGAYQLGRASTVFAEVGIALTEDMAAILGLHRADLPGCTGLLKSPLHEQVPLVGLNEVITCPAGEPRPLHRTA
jgi:hypothetical protein